jgi:hypothetical protein
MPQPHFTLTITATAVGWYAAIVSTLSSSVQFANYLRDRVHVGVKVQKNMQTVNDPVHEGMTLTMVKVTNSGRRPVTITNVGLMYLDDRTFPIFPANLPRANTSRPLLTRKSCASTRFGILSHTMRLGVNTGAISLRGTAAYIGGFAVNVPAKMGKTRRGGKTNTKTTHLPRVDSCIV